jgi:hypothetical protein
MASSMMVIEAKGSGGYARDCMDAGFDPWQLACSTCNVLPELVKIKCLSCCQSFKTLEKQAHHYKAALLLDNGISAAVDELLNEDYDKLLEQRKGLQVRKAQGGGMFRTEPSAIFWFDEPPEVGENVATLKTLASEVMILDGLNRDDLRDMLLALLPDAD